jgi:antitoxin (DNA-binding transcriptional repressor) of toxin-antitoxin stability system
MPAFRSSTGRFSNGRAAAVEIDHGHDPGYDLGVDSVSKSVLKAKMLEYFRRIEETGEELIVTDNNRPVLRIVPIRARTSAAEVFADVRGRVTYGEDVLAPTTDEWPET